MKKPNRTYRDRRVYFMQFAPNPMATWQRDDYTSEDINWISSDMFYKSFLTPLNEIEKVSKHIKQTVPGARLVYDMLLMLYGIEFESDDKLTWFMLKYA